MPTDRISGFNAGVSVKIGCQVATTGAITLSGIQTIDGVSVGTAGERVLVKNNAPATENGVWVADSSTWIRARDCDGNKDILPGSLVYVDRGNTNNRTFWVFNSSSTATSVTVGTDSITLSRVTQGLEQASSWVDTNFLPVTSSSSGLSVLGGLSSTVASSYVQTSVLPATSSGSFLTAIGATPDFINAKTYGCVGNGVTNDTTNMQAALTAASSGILYIPPGTYNLTNRLYSSACGLTIMGAGQGVTTLSWSSTVTAAGLALYTSSNAADLITVSGIRMVTYSSNSTQTALYISSTQMIFTISTQQVISGRYNGHVNVKECSITPSPTDNVNTGWLTGIELNSVTGAVISDCNIIGRFAATSSGLAGYSGVSGIYMHGDPMNTIENGHPVELVIDRCRINGAQLGIQSNNCEGIYVSQSNMVACDYGVYIISTASHPQACISGNHCNSAVAGVYIVGQVENFVSGNLVYLNAMANAGFGINIQTAADGQGGVYHTITGNTIVALSSTSNCYGVVISSGAGLAAISNNVFQSPSTIAINTAIWLQTGSYGCRGGHNVAVGNFTNTILNSGSSTNDVT